MLRCREVSKLVSESMERRLPLRQRMELWMHLALCRLCAGFARQVRLLRRAAQQDSERLVGDTTTPQANLSPEARERMKAALRTDPS
jgi:hypothetical protein